MFVGPSLIDANCQGNICQGNIYPGDICPYQENISAVTVTNFLDQFFWGIAALSFSRQLQLQLNWDNHMSTNPTQADPTQAGIIPICCTILPFATFIDTRGMESPSTSIFWQECWHCSRSPVGGLLADLKFGVCFYHSLSLTKYFLDQDFCYLIIFCKQFFWITDFPNLSYQSFQTKPAKPNQAYLTRHTNQRYQTKPTKQNIPNQT